MSRAARVTLSVLFVLLSGAMVAKLARRAVAGIDDLSIYFNASQLLWEGKTPYLGGKTSYLYPPVFAFLITPLTVFGPAPFAVLWGGLIGVCWLVAVHLCRRIVWPDREFGWLDIAASLILFRWIWSGWGHGQLALPLLALVLLVIHFEREGRDCAAAVVLAVAGSFKLFPLFIGLIFLKPVRWRPILILAVVTVGLHLLPAARIGFDRYLEILNGGFLGVALPEADSQRTFWDNRSPVAVAFRLMAIDSNTCHRVALLAWMIICAGLLVRIPRPARGEDQAWLAFLVASLPLVTPVAWPHYFTLLMFPVSVLVAGATGSTASRFVSRFALGAAAVSFYVGTSALVGTTTAAALEILQLPTVGALSIWIGTLLLAQRNSRTRTPATADHRWPDGCPPVVPGAGT